MYQNNPIIIAIIIAFNILPQIFSTRQNTKNPIIIDSIDITIVYDFFNQIINATSTTRATTVMIKGIAWKFPATA